ncbi:hypothetical protein D3C73_1424230 [compost metagenome]
MLIAKQIPMKLPVLSSPIRRARETAETAFGETNVSLEERLAGQGVDQVLEVIPENGVNQLLVAHHYDFNGQLKRNEGLDYLDAALLQPLGAGKGYQVVRLLNPLQESLIKYSKELVPSR